MVIEICHLVFYEYAVIHYSNYFERYQGSYLEIRTWSGSGISKIFHSSNIVLFDNSALDPGYNDSENRSKLLFSFYFLLFYFTSEELWLKRAKSTRRTDDTKLRNYAATKSKMQGQMFPTRIMLINSNERNPAILIEVNW